jgi:hypothetical protein
MKSDFGKNYLFFSGNSGHLQKMQIMITWGRGFRKEY